MAAAKTNEAYNALIAQLRVIQPSMAPRALQKALINKGFSRTDIQSAIQLALSTGAIKLDRSFKFEATSLQAAA